MTSIPFATSVSACVIQRHLVWRRGGETFLAWKAESELLSRQRYLNIPSTLELGSGTRPPLLIL